MNIAEIEGWPDATLYALLCRDSLPNVKEAAALELHRRGSKYVNSAEFAALKTQCELAQTTEAVKMLRSEVSILQQNFAEMQTAISRTTKRFAIWLGALSGVTVLAILTHIIWKI